MKVTDKQEDISAFKNSKYVFSSGYNAFNEIRDHLRQGHHVVAIGVSCQIAAMRKMYRNQPNIIFVEILCHGMTPHSYLQQHIATIETDMGTKAFRVNFRDPALKLKLLCLRCMTKMENVSTLKEPRMVTATNMVTIEV